jgi:glycosyltransferase involved in cell wall biosynthesis
MTSPAGLRLLSVTTYPYPPQHYGGSVMSTHDMCISLMEHGVRPTVLSKLWLRWPRASSFAYDVVRVRDPVAHIDTLVARLNPAVAVVQAGAQIECTRRLVALGIPTLVYVRDVLFERLSAPYFEHPLVQYVANSAFTAGEVRRAFGITCAVIPPLVRRAAYETEPERTHVVFVTPHRYKGVRTLFALARRLPQCKFLVVECWPLGPWERIKLQLEAKRLGNITWCAATADMRTIYRRARILLAPSRWNEGWGRVVTEAHISGIPVIATDIGGLPEALGAGGILIDRDAGEEEWAKAVERLWSDAAIYDGYVAAARAASRRPEVDEHHLCEALLAKFDAMRASQLV